MVINLKLCSAHHFIITKRADSVTSVTNLATAVAEVANHGITPNDPEMMQFKTKFLVIECSISFKYSETAIGLLYFN